VLLGEDVAAMQQMLKSAYQVRAENPTNGSPAADLFNVLAADSLSAMPVYNACARHQSTVKPC
jgi:hypothetical protein